MSDIRKWFVKQHDKPPKPSSAPAPAPENSKPRKPAAPSPPENSGRKKTSKYFAAPEEEVDAAATAAGRTPAKRQPHKAADDVKPPAAKKVHKEEEEDDEFEPHTKTSKKLKGAGGVGIAKKKVVVDESEDEGDDVKTPTKSAGRGRGRGKGSGQREKFVVDESEDEGDDVKTPTKSAGRGRGRGRGSGSLPENGKGRGGGGGRGGFMNFGERKDPPHKGEKEVPEGAPDCLAGLTFVISGTLDSLEREEAEDLIKRHGGRVTSSVSKKTNFLLADEDIGGRKSEKAKELGTAFLTEDGLFDMIRKSKPTTKSISKDTKRSPVKVDKSPIKSTPVKAVAKDDQVGFASKKSTVKTVPSSASPKKQKGKTGENNSLTWTEKYRPKVPNEIIGNQSIVKQLQDWLAQWHQQFLHNGPKGKGKKQNDSGSKKAVLMSGSPGIGKTTSAKLISQMLGFQTIEVNASVNRGKADSKINKGIGGNNSNSIKELIDNEAVDKNWSKRPKSVLIMDEVDGMSAGDRGGVADLINSIKGSKIPIICICNDRYSQKLKSLVNYCLALNFRKPTKQQMAKRLMQIANAEGIQVNEIALEELADRVNGDMRMALNQLQYMSLSHSVIKYDDIRERLLSSAKDEDISPFTAVDKLFGFNGGKLRMDERIDFCMSDPDLVPLIIQENYINYRPVSMGKDDNGVKRMNLLARAAESIGDGDIINVQIRRYRQWQLAQSGSFASSIIPAALMHGQRETLEPGERNFNRFGGWLGKNSTMGKNLRLLEDVHLHVLASQGSSLDRATLRIDYFSLLVKHLTDPLRMMPKDAAVQKVVEVMDAYSLSQEDFDTIVELSKFQGHLNPMDGIQPAVKAALTKAYKQGSSSRVIRAADLITLPGLKKAPKKRIAAILEPLESGLPEENGDGLVGGEEGSDTEDVDDEKEVDGKAELQLNVQNDERKGVQVQLDLKNGGKSNGKTPTSKSRGSTSADRGGQKAARGGKRKR
ncbi:replication factor C subunit 1 isoform X2 [Iris pallida]|uniref:Replication factor C subunit 1 n=1 Tax=Iris pallida TaxID=29817 RepID=A0AAX6IJ22_IRIPA|nr:replication factor C subunit 1 isoform X2 [Iris pallida]